MFTWGRLWVYFVQQLQVETTFSLCFWVCIPPSFWHLSFFSPVFLSRQIRKQFYSFQTKPFSKSTYSDFRLNRISVWQGIYSSFSFIFFSLKRPYSWNALRSIRHLLSLWMLVGFHQLRHAARWQPCSSLAVAHRDSCAMEPARRNDSCCGFGVQMQLCLPKLLDSGLFKDCPDDWFVSLTGHGYKFPLNVVLPKGQILPFSKKSRVCFWSGLRWWWKTASAFFFGGLMQWLLSDSCCSQPAARALCRVALCIPISWVARD